jgi:hypothetical protein
LASDGAASREERIVTANRAANKGERFNIGKLIDSVARIPNVFNSAAEMGRHGCMRQSISATTALHAG